jgi:hypothetical protein
MIGRCALPFAGEQSRVNNVLFIRVMHGLHAKVCIELNVGSNFCHCVCCIELTSDKANIGKDALIVSFSNCGNVKH